MARHPSFYSLGFLAGLALWSLSAPTPFPFLAMTAMTCGALGLVVSTLYVRAFEPWRWRVARVAIRRARRSVARAFALLAGAPPWRPVRASAISALRVGS